MLLWKEHQRQDLSSYGRSIYYVTPSGGRGGHKKYKNVLLTLNKSVTRGQGGVTNRAKTALRNL